MAAGMAVVGGVRAAGAIYGNKVEKAAAADQYSVDQQNIERMQEENAETIRRTQQDMERSEATAQTAGAGSGFAAGGVKSQYLEGMKGTHAADIAWLKESAESNVDIARSEAATRYGTAGSRSKANLITGLGSAAAVGVGSYGRYQTTGGWWS